MIFSAAVVVSVLSLLSSTRAATIRARQDGCTFVCPDKDLGGNALYASTTSNAVISCSYVGQPVNSCTYDWTSGAFVGQGNCPEHAAQQCVARRGAPDSNTEWERKRDDSDVPPPTSSVWPPYSPSPSWSSPPTSWSPSPSKPKPSYPPSTPQPCNFRCPQQDLANNLLTDEAFRGDYLFCGYSTPHCKTCSFCKYSTKTGLLLEDNDDGNCPKTASPARPWDRRFI